MRTIPPHSCSSLLLCLFFKLAFEFNMGFSPIMFLCLFSIVTACLSLTKKEVETEGFPILSLLQSQIWTYFTTQLFFPHSQFISVVGWFPPQHLKSSIKEVLKTKSFFISFPSTKGYCLFQSLSV